MKKLIFYTELAYIFGIIFLALGTAFMEHADFGMSMVVAPAYIIHLKVSQALPFFSFGMAEYTLQAVLIIIIIIALRKFKLSYLFSFITAVIYGITLDGVMLITAFIPGNGIICRLAFYLIGLLLCSIGVALFFRTYISPEAYELFVKEVSSKFGIEIHKFKTCYDCISCVVSIALSFAFFGLWHFEGINIGTVFCALLNGYLISLCSKFFDNHFEFIDKLAMQKYF